MHIRKLGGSLFQGSFPFGNKTPQTRPEGAFSFKVSVGREKPWRRKRKMQTNKERNKIKQPSIFCAPPKSDSEWLKTA